MDDQYIHIAGPVYITHSRDEAEYNPGKDQLSDEWFAEFFSGLDVLSARLPEIMKDFSEYRLDLRLRLGDGWISDGFFFNGMLPEFGRDSIRRFVDAVTVAQGAETIWATDESNLAQYAAHYLGHSSVEDVTRFVRYMESCDLDHEVDHGWQMMNVVKSHGWTPETVALWVARNGTCCGQHGHETEWQTPVGDTLQQWIGQDGTRRELLLGLLVRNMLALSDWEDTERGAAFMHEVIDDDIIDIFFKPTVLAEAGLGDSATEIVAEAATQVKAEISRHVEQSTQPRHWLDV